MRLETLLEAVPYTQHAGPPAAALELRGVSADSRKVGPGVLFVAVPGSAADGHDFLPQARGAGAAALLVERPPAQPQGDTPVLITPSTRLALGLALSALHGHPGRDPALPLVGITGTNGKTTVAYLVEAILAAAGQRVGVIGTVGARLDGEALPLGHTTPGPEQLQPLLAEMRRRGLEQGVLEVSSHALDQDRVAGALFEVAAFTNLSRDHLDYHPTLEDYFEAKAGLFERYLRPGARAVVNVDDPWGARLWTRLEAAGRPGLALSVAGALGGEGAPGATLRCEAAALSLAGVRATLRTPAGDALPLESPLVGAHNLENLAVAAGVALALGVGHEHIQAGLAACGGAPGRMERVADPHPGGRHLFVDYAHTDDAIRRVLAAIRALAPSEARLFIVFGCGGDRDRGKRPLMGAAAAAADLAIVTSDNPRGEDPQAIVDEILPGLGDTPHHVELDRAAAIARAVGLAGPGDVILVAGKGHEATQTIGGVASPFDDREVAAAALARVPPATAPHRQIP